MAVGAEEELQQLCREVEQLKQERDLPKVARHSSRRSSAEVRLLEVNRAGIGKPGAVQSQNDRTLEELAAAYAQKTGTTISKSSVDRLLKQAKVTRKKKSGTRY